MLSLFMTLRSKKHFEDVIQRHSMELLYNTVFTDVYRGSNKVLKRYRNKAQKSIYMNERTHMQRVAKSNILMARIIDYNDEEMYILMQDVGVDGVDLINSLKMRQRTWTLFYQQMYNTLNTIHKLGFVHRDIKPENVAFKDGRWALIDWAFAGPKVTPKDIRVVGTFPYVAPFMGNTNVMYTFLSYNDNSSVKVSNDRFAFALTTLSLATNIHEIRSSDEVCLNVWSIHQILASDPDSALGVCAMIVLSAVDINYKEIVWSNHKCHFRSPIAPQDAILTETMISGNINVSWDKLGSIIGKQIGDVTDDVQVENKYEESY